MPTPRHPEADVLRAVEASLRRIWRHGYHWLSAEGCATHATTSFRGLRADRLALALLVDLTPCLGLLMAGLVIQNALVLLVVFVHIGGASTNSVPATTWNWRNCRRAFERVKQVVQSSIVHRLGGRQLRTSNRSRAVLSTRYPARRYVIT